MNKKIIFTVVFILLIPIVFTTSIMITNNCIADKVERELSAIEMPNKTTFVDSLSIAGKIYGNGNGMQYIGELLITSDLSEEEINKHYKKFNEEITVKKQNSAQVIESEYYEKYQFANFDETQQYYKVELVKYNPATFDSNYSMLWKVLDFDIRGH
ncbi:MAG: hypothetical protein IJC79_00300 [Clostridia bacterium]|nr:hypothetical protein [Clostridia bacterium]